MTEEPDARRLRSVREGRLLEGPETLQVNLGNACDLDCVFCWSHSPLVERRPADWLGLRMSDAHLDDVRRSIPRLRPGRVQLAGGGEPLLHPRVRELLADLRRAAVPVGVLTNGVGGLSPGELIDLGVERLTVNVSAGTPEGYARVHPRHGARFATLVERLRQLAGGPTLTLLAVVQRTSTQEIVPLVELAGAVGAARVSLKGMEHTPGLEPLALDDADRAVVTGQLAAARARARALGVELEAAHLERILACAGVPRRFTDELATGPCYMGWYYCRVTCSGEVMFCCKDKRVGHLDHAPLYDVWRSPAYHLARLGARDGDPAAGPFDDKCRACSNFVRNGQVRAQLQATVGCTRPLAQ